MSFGMIPPQPQEEEEELTGGQKALSVMKSLAGVLGGAAYAAGVSGAAQNPWAGPHALAQLRQQGVEQEMRKMQMAAQTEHTRRQQGIMAHMQENFSDMSDPNQRQAAIQYLMGQGAFEYAEKASAIFGEMYPAAGGYNPTEYAPVKILSKDGATYGSRDQALGLQPMTGNEMPVPPPPPLVSFTEGGRLDERTAASQDNQYNELVFELGDEPLARDVINGKAFREPGLGIVVRGSAKVREQMAAAVAFQGTFADLEQVARDIASQGDTNILQTGMNKADRLATGAGNVGFEAYEQLKTIAVAEFLKATSGAQVNETERAFLLTTFPNYTELIRGGKISDTAQVKLDTWFRKGRRAYLSQVPASQKDKASAAWEARFGARGPRGASGANGSAPPAPATTGGWTIERVPE